MESVASQTVQVSIICNAYNHEKYIRDALEGFVMQKTNFAFEVLIHDDASTDKTADIIREYEAKYPDIIKPIYQNENQYSKGGGVSARFQIPRIRGRYVAFCEGDDYWTDPLKLQKQFDAMEAHPEVDMCAHGSLIIDAASGKEILKVDLSSSPCVIRVEEVIYGGGGFVSTASLFYRHTIYENQPKFRQVLSLDYTLQILGSLRGGLLYLNDCMCNYRYHTENSWSLSHTAESKRRLFDRLKCALEVLDEETNYKYSETIRRRIIKYEFEELIGKDKYSEVLSRKYRSVLKECSVLERIEIWIKAKFPILMRIKRKFIM